MQARRGEMKKFSAGPENFRIGTKVMENQCFLGLAFPHFRPAHSENLSRR
jgi:hypothetical protein